MKRDAIVNELNRYLRTPSITFEKGLMQTDTDTAFGYVSEMKNMDIKNGVVQRRKGSKFLSNPTITNKYIFMEELVINGVHFILGITENREVRGFMDLWEEIQFGIYKKGLFELSENLKSSADGFKLAFKRGQKFWLLEDNKYYKLINDFGDAVRINKLGYIQFMDTAERQAPDEWVLDEKISKARSNTTNTASNMGLYLELTDISHKKAPEFYLIPDTTKNSPELKGDIRVSSVNEAGYRGLWSEPIFLRDWKSAYVSKINGAMFQYNKQKDGYLYSVVKDSGYYSTENDNTDYNVINSIIVDVTTSGDTTTFKDNLAFSPKLDGVSSNFNLNKFEGNVTFVWKRDQSKLLLYTDQGNDYHWDGWVDDLFITLKELKFLKNVAATGGSGQPLTNSFYPKTQGVEITGTVMSLEEYGLIPRTYATWDGAVLVANNDYTSENVYSISLTDEMNDKLRKLAGDAVTVQTDGAVAFLTGDGVGVAKMDFVPSGGTTCQKARTNFILNNNVASLFETDTVRLMNCLGLDLWQNEVESIILSSLIMKAVDNGLWFSSQSTLTTIGINRALMDENSKESFAVWNDGFIKGVSQVFVQSPDSLTSPRYSIMDSPTGKDLNYTGTETGRNVNQSPVAYEKACMPIMSMNDTKLTRRYHTPNLLEEVINEPQHLIVNGGRIFSVQGKRVWIGSGETLLLNSYIDIDFTVNDMQPLYNGALLFTNKGLRLIDGNGKLNHVNTTKIKTEQIKASTTGASGVFAVSETEEVFFVHMVFNGDAKPYAEAIPLSKAIYTVEWTGNPKMCYIKDTLWIARDHDIWGFRDGGWSSKYVYTQKINNITKLNNELVVAFYGKRKRDDLETVTKEWS